MLRFLFGLLLLPVLSFAQDTHPFVYSVATSGVPCTWKVETKDSALNGKCLLRFVVTNTAGVPLQSADIVVKNKDRKKKHDTLIHSDANGVVSITYPADTLYMIGYAKGYGEIRTEHIPCKANSVSTFAFSLGKSNFRVGTLHSKRELMPAERDAIVTDLNLGREHELIQNKTCYVVWDI
ncbi:MAG TPA: hypothetical protein VK826_09895 [Bacteroidia bacterium]|nr:hypothetical protein [Bacteroidia bacterium]